jgi:hypothetical protein
MDYFDEIRCINLYSREDRYNHCKELFAKYNIPVNWYRTERHPTDPIRGCFESHVNCIKESYEKGHRNVLIFEDDIIIDDEKWEEGLSECINFMKTHSYDVFFLGCFPTILSPFTETIHITGNIYKVNACCTHGLLFQEDIWKKYLN